MANYGISCRCPLRREELPLLPCDCSQCSWAIKDTFYKNCFWVLAEQLLDNPQQLSIEDIAKLEGITPDEVNTIIEKAIHKMRKTTRLWEDYSLQDCADV
jgi:hypothetical protein